MKITRKMKKFISNIFSLTFEQQGLSLEDIQHHKNEYRLYVVSCFFYALTGFIRINQKAPIVGISFIIQSLLSYMSDVHTMGMASPWHLVDRYYAATISLYHFYSIRNSRKILLLNIVLFFIGCKYLSESQRLYSKHSPKFLIEHVKWHMVAPIMALTLGFNL